MAHLRPPASPARRGEYLKLKELLMEAFMKNSAVAFGQIQATLRKMLREDGFRDLRDDLKKFK